MLPRVGLQIVGDAKQDYIEKYLNFFGKMTTRRFYEQAIVGGVNTTRVPFTKLCRFAWHEFD